jgi:hypothetical protein
MSTEKCLKNLHSRYRYIPPRQTVLTAGPQQPVNCKQVKFTKSPEIRIFTGQVSKLEGQQPDEIIGIDFHCAVPYTDGAGGVILLLQVSSYIEWEIEFLSAPVQPQFCPAPYQEGSVPEQLRFSPAPKGQVVRETHRVFVSIPMMYKLQGPMMMLMAATPWQFKLPSYAARIWNAFQKLEELEKIVAQILLLKKGFCPEDIKALEEGLKKIETEANHRLQEVGRSNDGLAWRMQNKPDGTGRFAGTRLA